MIWVVILAAGLGLIENPSIPKCLLKIGKMTILERQLEILKWCGIDTDNIFVVIGAEGPCWSEENIKFVRKRVKKVILNERNLSTGSNYSLLLALNSMKIDKGDKILIIDGDVIFDKELIDSLIKIPYDNVVVSRVSYEVSNRGGRILVRGNKVINMGSNIRIETLPWYVYSGIAKLGAEIIDDLKVVLMNNPGKHVVDALGRLARKYDIYNLDIQSVREKPEPTFLIGGSGAKIRRIIIVRKEAFGEGAEKLSREIKWLLNLPSEIRKYFPEVISYKISKSYARLDTRYYDFPSLRRLLFLGEIDAEDATCLLMNLLELMFKYLYSRVYGKGNMGWLFTLHFERIAKRWPITMRRAPIFKRILKAKYVILNGKKLWNAPVLIQQIKVRPHLLEKLSPKIITMVHGDLHFQNILVNTSSCEKYNFILTDPRGELNGSDFVYDLGKLWHSFHGLYDFMHEDLFKLDLRISNSGDTIRAKIRLKNLSAVNEYRKIHYTLPEMLKDFVPLNKLDPDWEMRTLFTEAVHFCTLMPFHLRGDGKEERAIALYLTGVKILNEFCQKYDIFAYEERPEWLNINTLSDYLKAKRIWLRRQS